MALTKAQLIDLNGNELILDLDADTSITADTDDQIDIKIGGADDFRFTANTFTALSGSTIAAQALTATSITSTGNVVIPNAGTIGSASDADSIAISSGGVVTFSQSPVFPDGSLAVVDLDIDGATDIGAALVDADLLIVDDGASGTNRKVALSRVKTYIGSSTAADDLTIGDAAVLLTTSAGNITIDAAGNDTDIIFKGTDGSSDRVFMTIDGSEGGDLFLTGGLIDLKNDGSAVSQIKFYCESSNAHAQTLIGAPHSESGTNTLTLPSSGGNSKLLSATSTATVTNKTLTSPVINTGTFGTSILPTSADGTTLGSASKEFSDLFLADASTIQFGADQDVTLTHVADTGLLLNAAMKIQFRDAAIHISSTADGDLAIAADDEIDITSTLIDINGNVEISGTAVTTGVHTFTAVPVFPNNTIETADIQADAVDGTKIADDAINSEHYTDGSIDTAHIAADQIVASLIADDAINSEHYTDGSIDTAHLADGQVTIGKLATAVLTGATDIGAAIVDADLFLVDDGAGGTLRKTTAARIKTYATTGAITTITSLLATDIKIGEDDQTKIDFETADEIHLYAANAEQVFVSDGVFGPQTDSDVDLGTTGVRFKNAFIDTITTTGTITASGIITGTGFTAGSAVLAEAELELLDGITAGTTAASKVFTSDSNNLTAISGAVVLTEDTLSFDATQDWDVRASPNAKVTLTANVTFDAPSNPTTGQYISILCIQDGTGSRTIAWNAVFEFTGDETPTATTTAAKGDMFTFRYNGAKWLEVGRNFNLTLS